MSKITAQDSNKKPPNKKSRGEALATQDFLAPGAAGGQDFFKPAFCCLRQAAEPFCVRPEGQQQEIAGRRARKRDFLIPSWTVYVETKMHAQCRKVGKTL